MLILASILLSRSSNPSDPFSSIPADAIFSSNFPRDADPMPPCPRQRIQIVWACISTILAASWVSVHPNIPNAKESTIMKTLRRIELMTWAIITPELIIFWAMRQWRGARSMEKEFQAEFQHTELEPLTRKILRRLKNWGYQLRHFRGNRGKELTPSTQKTPPRIKNVKWTRTHGFFLQMGGFILREEGQEDRVLGWRTLVECYKQGRLDLSEITEARINDHSKADWFAKGLALLQMFWFITQCIARFFDKNLILTELELVTTALALLSLVMYFLWWNKPFNVGVPITITLLPEETDPQSKDDAISRPVSVADSTGTSLPIADAVNPNAPHAQPVEADGTRLDVSSVDEATPIPVVKRISRYPTLRQYNPINPPQYQDIGSCIGFSSLYLRSGLPPPTRPERADPRVQPELAPGSQPVDRQPPWSSTIESNKSSDGSQLWFKLFRRIQEILNDGFEFGVLIDPVDYLGHFSISTLTSVPTFYSIGAGYGTTHVMTLTSFCVASLFGCIHCIGWSSKIVFASHAASLAWRIASAVIAASPVVWSLTYIIGYVGSDRTRMLRRMLHYYLKMAVACRWLLAATVPVYIVARLTLLVLAFVELRHVPPGALASIQWANVLPFIH